MTASKEEQQKLLQVVEQWQKMGRARDVQISQLQNENELVQDKRKLTLNSQAWFTIYAKPCDALRRVTGSPYKTIWTPVATQLNARIDSESIRASRRTYVLNHFVWTSGYASHGLAYIVNKACTFMYSLPIMTTI